MVFRALHHAFQGGSHGLDSAVRDLCVRPETRQGSEESKIIRQEGQSRLLFF